MALSPTSVREVTQETGSGPFELVVQQVRLEADDVVSLTLADPGGSTLPSWSPGAHIDLKLPSGTMRQYSLCGDPEDRDTYTVAVLREEHGRGGSMEVHDSGLVGRRLTVRGPRNHFALAESEHYLFLAGGIGITPILAMIREVARAGADWSLHYGGRTRTSMAFVDQLLAAGPERVQITPLDQMGMLPIAELLEQAQPGTSIYCCGPEGMIRAVGDACVDAGLADLLHLERFGPATGPTLDAHTDDARATSFTVELRESGLELEVPADRTLLDVVREVVPDVGFSCEEGYCGSCETRVLAGTPLHNDTILSDEERERGDTMMICVGRSESPVLVLDL